MRKIFCDVPDCKKEAIKADLITCRGHYNEDNGKPIWKRPILQQMDLCEEHFEEWCKITYYLFYK